MMIKINTIIYKKYDISIRRFDHFLEDKKNKKFQSAWYELANIY